MFKKDFIISIALLVLSAILAKLNLFSIYDAAQVIYFLPLIIFLVFALTKKHYGRRSTIPEEKAEKVKSFIRSGIQILGTVIGLAAAFNLDIPLINSIRDSLGYLSENLDIAANAVLALLGIVTTIYGFFRNPERFTDRGTQVEGKELLQ